MNTRRLIVEEGGFLYDSDTYNDELPYWVEVSGRPHLVIPYSLAVNDSKFGRGVFATADDFYIFAKDSFDVLYREGARQAEDDVGGAAYAREWASWPISRAGTVAGLYAGP